MSWMYPDHYTLRHPTLQDLGGVAELIIACDLFERAESDSSAEELSPEWGRPDFHLDEDAWVLREFYQGGTRQVGFGVDAHNLTGANRLYEGAGMQVESEYIVYEKQLRPVGEF